MYIYIYIIKHRPQLVNKFSYMAGPLYSDSWYQTIHVRLSLYPMFIYNHISEKYCCAQVKRNSCSPYVACRKLHGRMAWKSAVFSSRLCAKSWSPVYPQWQAQGDLALGLPRGVGSTGPVNHDLCVNPSIVHVEELARYGWERRETSEMCWCSWYYTLW